MELTYDDRKLEKLAEKGQLQAKLGTRRGRLVERRLGTIRALSTAVETFTLPGNWHPLSADLAGFMACDLDQPFRLLLRPGDDPVPLTDDGGIDWRQVSHLVVVAIEDYHRK